MKTPDEEKNSSSSPQTEGPLPEKDEVKKAEDRTRLAQKKADEQDVAAELKIRSKDQPNKGE